MFESVDYDTVIVSSIIGAGYSLAVAFGVAYYVKKRMKPSSETVFEANRESDIKWIFNVLERYHDDAMHVFNEFENAFGDLSAKRKELVTEMKFVTEDKLKEMKPVPFKDILQDQQKMTELKARLDWNFNQMMKFSDDFRKSENISSLKNNFNYDKFLVPLFSLINNINDYANGLFQADLRAYSLKWAIKNAETIIKYLKDEKLEKFENIKLFIERWESAIKTFSE